MSKKIIGWLMLSLVMVAVFTLSSGCTQAQMFTTINAVAVQERVSDDLKIMSVEHPEISKILNSHVDAFTTEERVNLKAIDAIFVYVVESLEKYKNKDDIDKALDFEKMYENLEFAWKTITKSYGDAQKAISSNKASFTPDEYFKIQRFDRRLRTIDGDIRRLIKVADESPNSIMEIVGFALDVAIMVGQIKGAIEGDPNALIGISEKLSTIK